MYRSIGPCCLAHWEGSSASGGIWQGCAFYLRLRPSSARARKHQDNTSLGHDPPSRSAMPSSKGHTLSVRGIPLEMTKGELEDCFKGHVPGSEPFVGSLVRDSQSRTLCATVSLKDKESCKRAYKDLNGRKVWARRGHGSLSIQVDPWFYGITTLAEADDPQFDYYFLHGLGGHAFETFAGEWRKKQRHNEQKMWARDLLPEKFRAAKLEGRFSTVGYNANVVGNAGVTTIESAAIDLLQQLRLDRPEDCQRPIFFVAHSLGGLVVAQALILALDRQQNGDAADRMPLHGLVKGVVCMGTPFWGSLTADTMAPFVSALEKVNPFPVNSGLVKTLKANTPDLVEMVSHFGQVVHQNGIDIKIFFENLALSPHGLVTRPESATASLGQFVDPISINENHVGMVKFASSQDPNFRNVSEYLLRLTNKHLGGGGVIPTHTLYHTLPRPPSYFSHVSDSSYHGRDSDDNTWQPSPNGFGRFQPSPDSIAAQTSSVMERHRIISRSKTDTFDRSLSTHVGRNISTKASPPQQPRSYQFSPPAVAALSPTKPQFAPSSGLENHQNFARLKEWDTVFVVDDTGSMNLAADSVAASRSKHGTTSRWDLLVLAMRYIVNIATEYDEDGVDVYFLCSQELNAPKIKSEDEVFAQLMKVNIDLTSGGTKFEPALSPILTDYIMRYTAFYDARKRGEPSDPPKPMNIIIFTDGEADDGLPTEKLLVRVAKELDNMWAPSYQLGIQFVQVGDDPKATKYLNLLDTRLESKHGIRDMVDTTSFKHMTDGVALGQKIVKIIFGAMDRAIDNEDDEGAKSSDEEDPYRDL